MKRQSAIMTHAIETDMAHLVEFMGNHPLETKAVRTEAWQQLLVYVPREEFQVHMDKIKEKESS
ncbi:hypothetical protein AWB81_01867 [Caballeronia arationis]|uniref:hypothetical protein n=1 Tax=Caballeronia arationis TaxID=1777142 RepID=UPI00074BD672|nr:hypothetical protein [Caballeronia arationis]SAK59597.1 hypothetical protein AWB81_01867 [Caballeronia arationis]